LSTHGKRLRKDKASEPTFVILQKLKLEMSDDLKSKFQSLKYCMFNKATLRLLSQKAKSSRQVAKVVELGKQENKLIDLAKR
jgi:hypothetical protein